MSDLSRLTGVKEYLKAKVPQGQSTVMWMMYVALHRTPLGKKNKVSIGSFPLLTPVRHY